MSSESEDDCYGNVAQQLQKLKSRYKDDKIDCAQLLDDSKELEEIVKFNTEPAKNTRKSTSKPAKEPADTSVSTIKPKKEPSNTSVSELLDSTELDEIVKNNPIPAKTTRKNAKKNAPNTSADDALPSISNESVSRRTRSSKKALEAELPVAFPAPRGRRKKKTITPNTSVNNTSLNSSGASTSSTSSRGGRGRGGRGRSRGRARSNPRNRNRGFRMWMPRRGWLPRHLFDSMFDEDNYDDDDEDDVPMRSLPASLSAALSHYPNIQQDIPIFSIGNTDEYTDQSNNQALFSNRPKPAEVVTVEEDNIENEELNVKVYWTSSEYYKFTIRRFQKLTTIFDYFVQKENIGQDKLLFRLDGKILKPDDTPDSIGYNISKIIDGGIVEQGVSNLITSKSVVTGGFKLKFQCQNMKKPLELPVTPEERFSMIMLRVAEHFEKPLEALRFEFDGDMLSGKSTVEELEFEGGECIDVKVVS